MIAFLEKPAESNGFQEIIDFLNANQIHYALTVNPTIYTSCIEQFWATAKVKTVNDERQLQALVNKKKVIITKSSIRSDLHLENAGGIDCLPTATIFEELAMVGYEKPSQRLTFYKAFFSPQWKFLIHTIMQCLSAKTTAWNEFSSTMASLGDMSHHKKIYVNPSHIKKIFANMKREGKDFSGRVTPLFATMIVQANQEEGIDSGIPTDSQQTPITTQPSSSRPQKKQPRRKQRKETEVPQDETHHDDSVPIPSNDPLLSVDETQGRSDDAEMFDTDDLHGDEVIMDMAVSEKQEQSAKVDEREVSTGVKDSAAPTIPVTTAGEGVTATKINEITTTSAPTTAIDEITLAQTLIEIKTAKPKAVTTATTTTTTTIRPKARGVVVQEPSEFRTTTSSPQASQPSKTKDKGKEIMIELEVPLKKKDQVALDEEMARNLEAQLQVEPIEEERLARKKEEEVNIALIESWENTQAMMEADRLLAERIQTKEQEELTDEEKAKLFREFMEKKRKHFAALRAQEKRNTPHTKT
ncbi:hypothetical protein Tco_1252838 [Tanacetum coccineum]